MSPRTQIAAGSRFSTQSLIFYLLCASFVVNGIIITFIGPILPVFIAKWNLDDSRAGLFSFTQFSGSIAGVLASSVLTSAKGFKPAITIGLAMMGVGFALLDAPTFPLALAASAFYGVGYGLSTPGTNLWVGESYGVRRASALNVINLAWGAGAICASPLVMLTVRKAQVSLLLYIVGAMCVAIAAALLRMPFEKPPGNALPVSANPVSGSGKTSASAAGTWIAILLGVLFFVYVGTENGISYWAPAHAKRAAMWAANTWTLAPMFFFAGLLGGRGVAAAILMRLKERAVAVGGVLLAAASELIFLSAHSPLVLFTSVFFAGLGMASLYPIFIAWLSEWFGARARKVGGVLFALAAGGGAVMPPLVGVVSRQAASLSIGLLVPFAGCLIMLAVIVPLRPRQRACLQDAV